MSEIFRPRVLMLSAPIEPPWTRSDKNLVRDLALGLQRHRARVLTHEGVLGALPPHVETEPAWGPRDLGDTPLGRRLGLFGRLLQAADVQIAHLFWPADPVVAPIVRVGARGAGVPVIHSLVRAPRNTMAIRQLIAGGPVVALSRETARRLRDEGLQQVEYIPHGVPRSALGRLDDGERASLGAIVRARHGLPLGPPLVIYAGDYRHAYAARTVAAVLPRVVREVPCHFVIACRLQDDADRLEEQRIRAAIAADGLGGHVTFLNVIPDLRELMAICAVQIFPADSVNERMDMPRVLLEGMAEGLATVVANKPPFEEVVEPGGAIGVPTLQPVAIATAVVELLRDPARQRAYGEAARSLVHAGFAIDQVVERYESLYERVLQDEVQSRTARRPGILRRTGHKIASLRRQSQAK